MSPIKASYGQHKPIILELFQVINKIETGVSVGVSEQATQLKGLTGGSPEVAKFKAGNLSQRQKKMLKRIHELGFGLVSQGHC